MAGLDISKYQQKEKAAESPTGSFMDWMNRDIQLFGTGLSDKKKERFYGELNVLLASGVDLKSALELMKEEQEKEADKKLLTEIRQAIIEGTSLAETMENSAKFTAYEFHSVAIGEETAQLNRVLGDLNHYYDRKIAQRRQITSALAYPSIVIATAIGAVFFMMKFIVPLFADVFQRFGSELPGLTKAVLALSNSVEQNFWYVSAIIVLTSVFFYSQKKKDWFRKYASFVVLKLPLAGTLYRKIYLARFCQTMALLISSKIPLIEAIRLVKKMIGFHPIESTLTQIENDILQGESLHQSLSQFPIYTTRMVSLIKVGGEVNQLDTMFEKLSDQFTKEVEHQTSILGSLLEPLLIIFLGLVVGVILVAMYLPMFELSMQFG